MRPLLQNQRRPSTVQTSKQVVTSDDQLTRQTDCTGPKTKLCCLQMGNCDETLNQGWFVLSFPVRIFLGKALFSPRPFHTQSKRHEAHAIFSQQHVFFLLRSSFAHHKIFTLKNINLTQKDMSFWPKTDNSFESVVLFLEKFERLVNSHPRIFSKFWENPVKFYHCSATLFWFKNTLRNSAEHISCLLNKTQLLNVFGERLPPS